MRSRVNTHTFGCNYENSFQITVNFHCLINDDDNNDHQSKCSQKTLKMNNVYIDLNINIIFQCQCLLSRNAYGITLHVCVIRFAFHYTNMFNYARSSKFMERREDLYGCVFVCWSILLSTSPFTFDIFFKSPVAHCI